ncbi:MAG: hypothetical protein R3E04_02030 [Sphingobium sp.]
MVRRIILVAAIIGTLAYTGFRPQDLSRGITYFSEFMDQIMMGRTH